MASFVALCAVLALEGLVWMDRRGVFLLDGDPPKGFVSTKDVVLDIFSTGMWFGHALLWVLGVLIGAMLGALVARHPERRKPGRATHGQS